jgi:hypothetical protein
MHCERHLPSRSRPDHGLLVVEQMDTGSRPLCFLASCGVFKTDSSNVCGESGTIFQPNVGPIIRNSKPMAARFRCNSSFFRVVERTT